MLVTDYWLAVHLRGNRKQCLKNACCLIKNMAFLIARRLYSLSHGDNNVSDNGLWRDSTKPLPQARLTQDYRHPYLCNSAGSVQDIVARIMI